MTAPATETLPGVGDFTAGWNAGRGFARAEPGKACRT
jgi:hypothetical protein